MPDHTTIAAVSETLEVFVTGALSTLAPGPPVAKVHDLTAAINPPMVTIFLFEVGEDPSCRNRPRMRTPTAAGAQVSKAPMALLLRYMLTAWGGNVGGVLGTLDEQRMLGRVMQVLYDRPVLSGPLLQGKLAGTSDALRVTLGPLDLEERTRIWHAIQRPYRLSITYDVRVANLDAELVEPAPVVRRRTLDYLVPAGGGGS